MTWLIGERDKMLVTWRTSSYSSNGGDCVEVATGPEVLVRDTKDREGGTLAASTPAWRALLGRLR